LPDTVQSRIGGKRFPDAGENRNGDKRNILTMRAYRYKNVAATPYAKLLAAELGVDLETAPSTGVYVKAADVLAAALSAVKITPLARRIADAERLDVGNLRGSGCAGRIYSGDLEQARTASLGDATLGFDAHDNAVVIPMTNMRRIIARRMQESAGEIPAVTQNMEIDATEIFALRKILAERRPKDERASVNAFLIRAVALVVRERERFRMQIYGDSYVMHSAVNIGFAVGMDDGLLVPVIRNADKLSVYEIAAAADELARRARGGLLKPWDYGCGVITISNMGMYGLHSFTSIINRPEASIVGVGAPFDKLALSEDGIRQRRMMMLSLTFDHRILNGTEGAGFLLRMKELLERPERLIDTDREEQ
jgi:pyruvate dehydrogenase E2 component (dihydrolipoamide acetyltransferase)